MSNIDRPALALRVAPKGHSVRNDRVKELERIVGSTPLIGSMNNNSSVADIIGEARGLNADVIVLDADTKLRGEIAQEAVRHDIAVVVAPNIEIKPEPYGRGTVTEFHGYERVGPHDDQLSPIDDGGLKNEIERRRARQHEREEGHGY